MAVSPYRVTPARIGNSSGLRLPAAFYRDHPQFAGAAGQVEVLDDSTLLLPLVQRRRARSWGCTERLVLHWRNTKQGRSPAAVPLPCSGMEHGTGLRGLGHAVKQCT